MPVLLLALLCVPGCWRRASIGQTAFSGQTMGTTYTVKVVPSTLLASPVERVEMRRAVEGALSAVDDTMSTYRDDSELSRFNASDSTEWFDVSCDTAEVIDEALRVGRLSDGALDVTIEPLVRLWNFGAGATPTDKVPSDKRIAQCKKSVGLEHLSVRLDPPALKKDRPDVHVDLSSIAKGFAVDRVAERLDRLGFENYMVEVGGEVRARGHNSLGQPWQIAVERPTDGPKQVHRVIALADRAMATSGDYRNYFEQDGRRYSHLIDPRSGKPITHRLASVTVLADRCMTADAWATALAVLGPEAGMARAEREGIAAAFLIRENHGFVERCSPAFPSVPKQ
ncbi:MAG: FAD:protein FMN transferase [Pirellulales bacterium]|nr:FAD:protein FMN transferase [Pirellulales bacterium]